MPMGTCVNTRTKSSVQQQQQQQVWGFLGQKMHTNRRQKQEERPTRTTNNPPSLHLHPTNKGRNHIFDSVRSLLKPAILTCCARISRTTLASQIHARANKCPTRQRGLVLPDGLATTGSCCSPSGWSRGATTWVNSNTQKIVRFS